MNRYEQLEAKFRRFGIDMSKPGFYDDPAFLDAERGGDSDLLGNYVEYAAQRPYESEFLVRARQVTKELCLFLRQKLLADGRLGACVNCSGAMMRMLEQEGIWCYMMNGGLRIEFAGDRQPSTLHFYSFRVESGNDAFAAHCWLGVPPYRIVDVSVSRQTYPPGVTERLPSCVLAEACMPGAYHYLELVEPTLIQIMVRRVGREPSVADLESQTPGFQTCGEMFGILAVEVATAKLTYWPCAPLFPLESLEEFKGIRLCDLTPPELFAEFQARERPSDRMSSEQQQTSEQGP